MDVFLIPHDSTTTLMGDKNEKRSGEEKAEEEYPEIFLPTEYKKSLMMIQSKSLRRLFDGVEH